MILYQKQKLKSWKPGFYVLLRLITCTKSAQKNSTCSASVTISSLLRVSKEAVFDEITSIMSDEILIMAEKTTALSITTKNAHN